MVRMMQFRASPAILLAALFALNARAALPTFVTKGDSKQLVVGGKPFLARGIELANWALDAPSDMQYADAYFTALKNAGFNFVLAPVSWTFLEPAEGSFNYEVIDGLIAAARSKGLKLGILWFGAIKNGNYWFAPDWFRSNPTRFFSAQTAAGVNNTAGVISPFCQAAMDADRTAFTQLMKRIKLDDPSGTVCVLMQPENETGLITQDETRDYCAQATAAWNAAVPAELMTYLTAHDGSLIPWLQTIWNAQGKRTSGTWSQVFGTDAKAQKIFMAYYIAKYVEYVAAGGLAEHDLPAYANDWLGSVGEPGGPIGGPEWELMDIWRAAAPHIEAYGPDIYQGNFKYWTDSFHQNGNPLIVPEAGCGSSSAAQCWYAYCKDDAICYSPYFYCAGNTEQTVDPSVFSAAVANMALGTSYKIIADMDSVILDKQDKSPAEITAFLKDGGESATDWQESFQGYTVKAHTNGGSGIPPFCAVLKMAANDFVAIGTKMTLTFTASGIAVVSAEKGRFVSNAWTKSAELALAKNGNDVSYTFSADATTIEQIRFRLSSPATVAEFSSGPASADFGLRIVKQGTLLICRLPHGEHATAVRIYAADGTLMQSVNVISGNSMAAMRPMPAGVYWAVMPMGTQQARIAFTTAQ